MGGGGGGGVEGGGVKMNLKKIILKIMRVITLVI